MKMNKIKILVLAMIFGGQLAVADSVSAARVQVGDGSGNTVQFSTEAHVVSSIDCVPKEGGIKAESAVSYRVAGDNTGARQTATVSYAKAEGDSLYTEAWCDSEEDRIATDLAAANVAMYSGVGERNLVDFADAAADCETSILGISCGDENGVWELLSLILNIMTAGVVVLAIVGITISGIQWLTARDNESQIVKAKSRIFNVVLGLVVWAVMWLVLSWLIPGGINLGGA